MFRNTTVVFAFFVFALLISACSGIQKVRYFEDLNDSVKVSSMQSAIYKDPVIQADDILQINIQTIDPQSATPLNQSSPLSVSTGLSGTTQISGYLVDKDGAVSIPMIGSVPVVGLTTSEARDRIRQRASEFYKSPVVQVRFGNFKVTVLGEVSRPATYTVPNEKVTILDAIGMAGDLTIYGKRENVLLVRDSLGVKNFVRFDLNSSAIFKSPYFYLKQNDLLYVEPNKAKIATTDAAKTRNITVGASILSALLILLIRIR